MGDMEPHLCLLIGQGRVTRLTCLLMVFTVSLACFCTADVPRWNLPGRTGERAVIIVGELDLNISSLQFELKEKKRSPAQGNTGRVCERPLRISAVTSLMRESWTSPRLLGILGSLG